MSLARAFTKRTKRNPDNELSREGSFRFAAGTIKRNQISLPTELISTTNMHALTAPDIHSLSTSSSNSSINSAQDSEFSHISRSFINTPATSAETSSIEESSPNTPDTSVTTNFFDPLTKLSTANNATEAPILDTPAVPQRAPSHSKKAHQELARKRSISRLSPPPTAIGNNIIVRHSADFFGGANDLNHPFGKELAQVNEVAEEFGATSALLDEEEQLLQSQGLMKFSVEDYVNEITGLYGGVYGGRLGPMANPWL